VVIGFQVVFDAADPDKLAKFWGAALGYVEQPPPPGHDSWDSFLDSIGVPEDKRNDASAVIDPDGKRPRIYFQRVPERKAGKNRVHLDINASTGRADPDRAAKVEDQVERVVALGATVVSRNSDNHGGWVVMQDPEGNEFCVH
jgi:Glyoxalase-like domain